MREMREGPSGKREERRVKKAEQRNKGEPEM